MAGSGGGGLGFCPVSLSLSTRSSTIDCESGLLLSSGELLPGEIYGADADAVILSWLGEFELRMWVLDWLVARKFPGEAR